MTTLPALLTTTELSFLLNTSSYVQLTKLHHIPAYNERIRQPLALAETSFPACSDHHITASGVEEEEELGVVVQAVVC